MGLFGKLFQAAQDLKDTADSISSSKGAFESSGDDTLISIFNGNNSSKAHKVAAYSLLKDRGYDVDEMKCDEEKLAKIQEESERLEKLSIHELIDVLKNDKSSRLEKRMAQRSAEIKKNDLSDEELFLIIKGGYPYPLTEYWANKELQSRGYTIRMIMDKTK